MPGLHYERRLRSFASVLAFAFASVLAFVSGHSAVSLASDPLDSNPGLSSESPSWAFGGYGEILTTTRFYGPDPNLEYAPSKYRDTDVDLRRIVATVEGPVSTTIGFNAELEFEHGGTGTAMEVEWEEFGEYESEVEKGGEIILEQAYLQFELWRHTVIRAGHVLVPIGLISQYHLPILFSGVSRPESEEHLIPSTWHETGIEYLLQYGGVAVDAQLVTGLDSTGFSSERWLAGGNQRHFETTRADDPAGVLRLQYLGLAGLLVGVSGYTGNTSDNRPKPDMDGAQGRVTLVDAHARYAMGWLQVRALGLLGFLDDAARITDKNASLSQELGAPRTPVGRRAYAVHVEAAVDTLSLLSVSTELRLDAFARFEEYDTMLRGPVPGGFDNPLLHRRVAAGGFDFFPHSRVVIKTEGLIRFIDKDYSWARRQYEVGAALGFVL